KDENFGVLFKSLPQTKNQRLLSKQYLHFLLVPLHNIFPLLASFFTLWFNCTITECKNIRQTKMLGIHHACFNQKFFSCFLIEPFNWTSIYAQFSRSRQQIP